MGNPVAGSTRLGTAPLAPPPTKLNHAAGGIGGSMSAAFEPPGLVAWLIVGGVAIAAGAGGAQRRAACRSRRRRPQWAEALASQGFSDKALSSWSLRQAGRKEFLQFRDWRTGTKKENVPST